MREFEEEDVTSSVVLFSSFDFLEFEDVDVVGVIGFGKGVFDGEVDVLFEVCFVGSSDGVLESDSDEFLFVGVEEVDVDDVVAVDIDGWDVFNENGGVDGEMDIGIGFHSFREQVHEHL